MHVLNRNRVPRNRRDWAVVSALAFVIFAGVFASSMGKEPAEREPAVGKSSYDQISPVLLGQETFAARLAKDKAEKPAVMARQKKVLDERYDLTSRPDQKVSMSRGKPVQIGPTAKLTAGTTWERLPEMPADEIREKGLFPKGFLPLPHPKQEVGGMVFPQNEIKQLRRLERFHLISTCPSRSFRSFRPPSI